MMAKVLVLAAVAVGTILALWWTEQPPVTPQPAVTPPVEGFAPEGVVPWRGMSVQVASGYKPVETYGKLLDEIAGLGANAVLLSVAGYMENATSQSIYIDSRKVPSSEDFKAIVRHARQLGLKTIIMPIVLLKNPRGSEWRGVIEPAGGGVEAWDDWWEQYTEFVYYFTDIAREGQADALIVGSELVSTEKYTDRWVKLIDAVRPRFYGGKLGYSANWDHFRPIEFWDKLDFIGMTSYFTLADKKDPTVEEIAKKWEPIKKDILAWQRRIGKPILLTEVGWCSQEGAATAPWNYYQNQKATPAGLEEQRRLYEAFLEVWGNTPELLGVMWWEWDAVPGGPEDFGYSPKGKPAEQVLRRWFAELHTGGAGIPPARQP